MGFISFIKNAGKKLFGGKKEEAAAPVTQAASPLSKTDLLKAEVERLGIPVSNLEVEVSEMVTISGVTSTNADREKVVIEADAYRQAEQTRGEGDAQAAAIYASAYNKDPEFYAFSRRLNAYETSFSNKGDMLLVDPDSDFFRYLNKVDGE